MGGLPVGFSATHCCRLGLLLVARPSIQVSQLGFTLQPTPTYDYNFGNYRNFNGHLKHFGFSVASCLSNPQQLPKSFPPFRPFSTAIFLKRWFFPSCVASCQKLEGDKSLIFSKSFNIFNFSFKSQESERIDHNSPSPSAEEVSPSDSDANLPLAQVSSEEEFVNAGDNSPISTEDPIRVLSHQIYRFSIISLKIGQLIGLLVPFLFFLTSWTVVHLIRRSLETFATFIKGLFIPLPSNVEFLAFKTIDHGLEEYIWTFFYWAVAEAGPCYIKFVQWAGTRSDLFSHSLCSRFTRFHWDVPPHPYPYTVKTLKECFGDDWNNFIWIEPETLGAGCIAQVYRGIVLENHNNDLSNSKTATQFREVAMKIVHPHVAYAMKIDLDVMEIVAKIIDRIPGAEYLSLADHVQQFKNMMIPQLNMTIEAENLEKFRRNLSRPSSRKHLRRLGTRIVVPKIFKDLCSPNLLVQSYEEGMVLGEWMRVTSNSNKETTCTDGKNAKQWSSKGFYLTYLEDTSAVTTLRRDILAPRPTFLAELRQRLPHLVETGKGVVEDQIHNIKIGIKGIFLRFCAKFGVVYEGVSDPTISNDYGTRSYWTDVAHAGLAFFLQMVFTDNFVHADLHPGNLIIRFRKKENRKTETATIKTWSERFNHLKGWLQYHPPKIEEKDTSLLTREQLKERLLQRLRKSKNNLSAVFVGDFEDVDFELVLLDCGLTTSLSVREYCNFTDLLRCICVGDGYTGERARKEACPDINKFCQEIDEIVQIYHATSDGSLKLSETKIGEILSRMLRVSCHHRVELDPRFAALIVAVAVLEGVGRQLDPNIDLLRAALPYVKVSIKEKEGCFNVL